MGEEQSAGDEEVMLETDMTGKTSESMREGLTAVGKEWMGVWLKQWGF